MKNIRERIYINEWLELKPYSKQVPTDIYYLKLSNEVKQAIYSGSKSYLLLTYLERQEINVLSCFLTSYFEDIISETGIWTAFVRRHTRLYRKPLPFYVTDEYYDGEINLQDICFLIWYFLNTIQQERFITPFNGFINEIAEQVYDVFDAEWDNAPENPALKSYYQIEENETDFYKVRSLIDTTLFKTYLFYPDTFLRLQIAELELIEKCEGNHHLTAFLNENRDSKLHQLHTRLLALTGKEWASEILGGNHPQGSHIRNMSQKITGYFLYKGQDDKDIFIEHIASGRRFNLTKKSFDHHQELKKIDTIVCMGIAKWQSEWWFSGVFFMNDFNADLVLDQKNSFESRAAVNFLDHQEQNMDEMLERQLKAFKGFNRGHQIAFAKSEKINEFIGEYSNYLNNSLKLTKKQLDEADRRAKAEGFFGDEKKPIDFSEVSESGLIFFNPKSGVEVALGVNSAFPLSNNRFFDPEQSKDQVMRLLFSEEMSTELAMFCIDHCKSNLPFFQENEGKLFLNDIDFLLRFWKNNIYFSKPSITITGKSGVTGNE